MKTKDLLSMGIDRNFLRACLREKLIHPKELDNEWIINKNYVPREYSQKDAEIVWYSYLCRKMGLSYEQIKDLNDGKTINPSKPITELIHKYETQIEELQALIEFMKYVKGIGFVPAPPNGFIGSTDLKSYVDDFINYIDEDKKIKKVLNLLDYITKFENIESIENLETEDFGRIIEQIKKLINEANVEIDQRDSTTYNSAILELKSKTSLDPNCAEIQELVQQILESTKRHNEDNLTTREVAIVLMDLLLCESDLTIMYKMILGEKGFDFLILAIKGYIES